MVNDPTKELEELIKNYNKQKLDSLIIKGLDEAEKVVINNLKSDSHVSGEAGPHFRDCWEAKPKYRRYVRYIHNTKKVPYNEPGRGLHDVPLSNILEYAASSPYRGRIKRTMNRTKKSVQQAFINRVKGGL